MDNQSGHEATAWLSGVWRLVPRNTEQLSVHSMDMHFFGTAAGLNGTIIPKVGHGPEIPLQQIAFDGATLTLCLNSGTSDQRSMPTLVMRRVGDEFEGDWSKEGQTIGIALKLIRGGHS